MTPKNWTNELERFVTLHRSGSRYTCLCPYHSEMTPSCVIYPETNSFHCFGCRQGGSLRKLLRHLGYKETLELRPFTKIQPEPKKVQKEIEKRSLDFWHLQLKEKRTYFYERGFTEEDVNFHYFGYAPNYGRYVIPVWEGKPNESKCFSVRLRSRGNVLPKYMGMKGQNDPTIFNKWVLKNAPLVFIVFGEIDALSVCKMGIPAVSPTAGVGSFKEDWLNWFDDNERIIIIPDNTAQELSEACALVEMLENRARIGYWPIDVKDANEYYLKYRTLEEFWKINSELNLGGNYLQNLKPGL